MLTDKDTSPADADGAAGEAFAAFDLLTRPSIVVAVSGGSDSLALLTLLKDYLARFDRAPTIRAVTIDHALRPEAADEARAVRRLCAEFGIEHDIRRWDGSKPTTGIADAARQARYGLLIDAADKAGTDLILTGHTADDQAETVAMRRTRGDGIGLAGMAATTLLGGRTWLLRPFLGMRRFALRKMLQARSIRWIDDPSNDNSASERVRVRKALAPDDIGPLLDLAGRAGHERLALGEAAADLIGDCSYAEGTIAISNRLLQSSPDRAVHASRFLLAHLGRQPHLPDAARTNALLAAIAEKGATATLSGCVVAHRRAGTSIRPEVRRGEPAHESVPPMRPIIPGFDLAPAQAIAHLTGAAEVPVQAGPALLPTQRRIPLTERV